MSKNIFSVLAKHDSDDEGKKAKTGDKETSKADQPSKKAQRAQNEKLRDSYDTTGGKQETQHIPDGKKVKDDYASGEKRPYERHSGTGRQAFGQSFKKGGFGRGNAGKEDGGHYVQKGNDLVKENEKLLETEDRAEVKALGEDGRASTDKPKPEPKPEIKMLDEYMKEKNLNFGKDQEGSAPVKGPKVEDPDLKPIAKQKKHEEDNHVQKKKKNPDLLLQAQTNSILPENLGDPSLSRKNTQSDKAKSKKNYTEDDFPQLK